MSILLPVLRYNIIPIVCCLSILIPVYILFAIAVYEDTGAITTMNEIISYMGGRMLAQLRGGALFAYVARPSRVDRHGRSYLSPDAPA